MQTGGENKANHQLGDIALMYHQVLVINIEFLRTISIHYQGDS